MIKLSNIRIPYNLQETEYMEYIAKKLKIKKEEIISCHLMKKSLDARKSNDIHYVCTFKIRAKCENKLLKNKSINAVRYNIKKYKFPYDNINTDTPPVIIGSGPAGLFCALCLARTGMKPIVIEQGEAVEERCKTVKSFKTNGILNTNSNIQFGEGGAGTFSDGKLTCGVNDERMEFVLREFAAHGAPNDILTNAKPHIGTDYLWKTVKNLRDEVISLGGKVYFNTLMTDIDIKDSKVKGVHIRNIKTGKEEYFSCRTLVCAIGHSSRITYEMMSAKGFEMEKKPFSIGVRIEHKREYINMLRYKEMFKDEALPTADYKLSCHVDSGSGYTFCMCPGGEVVCGASEKDSLCTNGMSEFKRMADNSNSAILVSVTPEHINDENVLGGMYFQRDLEKKAFELGGGGYFAPCQRVGDFMNNRETISYGDVYPTYKPGVKYADLNKILPGFIKETLKKSLVEFDKKMKGFCLDDALLTGVETRSSAPVRILRDESGQSNIKGVYPAGEGAGYAGGIMSSAVDGIKCAEKICYAELNE